MQVEDKLYSSSTSEAVFVKSCWNCPLDGSALPGAGDGIQVLYLCENDGSNNYFKNFPQDGPVFLVKVDYIFVSML